MRHVAQFLAEVYNSSIMCTAPSHTPIGPDQVTLYPVTHPEYRVTYRDLAKADRILARDPSAAAYALGISQDPEDQVEVLELVANWYAEQIGLL